MKRQMPSTKEIEREIKNRVKNMFRKEFTEATEEEIYRACSEVVNEVVIDNWLNTQKEFNKQDPKCVYYMSMEFLIGRLLGNNMINMRGYTEVMDALDNLGVDINAIEDQEPDPALGNGGLGRLAACFLDSLATLRYPAYGCGIRYHYGMFKQKIVDGYQEEVPDNWLQTRYPFELERPEYEFEVKFGGWVRYDAQPDGTTKYIHEGYNSVIATPYDMPVTGFDNGMVNTLMIWDAKPKEVFRLDSFERGDYNKAVEDMNLARNLTEVLYPNDNHIQGKELRLKQQYFFVSASLQRAIAKFFRHHSDIKQLPEKVVFQMNDTHPTLTVAELMRLLMDERGLGWDEAWDITTHCVAYTNHTIMSEALEKWPQDIFKNLLPRIYMIVEEINRRFCEEIRAKFPGDDARVARMAILADGQVKMAHMAIAASFSVNGVAALHTEILKNVSLHDFYEMYPDKFNNKTNGITQRRFLMHGNYKLSDWVISKIGRGWITDLSQMQKLERYINDQRSIKEFMEIKLENKKRLAKYIWEHNGINVDPNSIFDVQVKRLHEYKRQLLNILHVMYLYNQIKENPEMDFYPTTFIFGAKASAGYENAKLIIKLINNVAAVINNDKSIDDKLKVVFIEDYRVSNAEWIFAAADVSEQISTASKEASGTGNMKFMLNGAVTIGTMDGANVEMYQELGGKNIFIFGMSSDEVIAHEKNNDYNPMDVMNSDYRIQKVLQQLVNGNYSIENPELFRPLYNSLLNTQCTAKADTYFVLKDFASYCEAHEKIQEAYKDRFKWGQMALENVAHVGKFSSDRTIQEYVDDIWHLDKLDLH
ncbi:glycogen/starch/alpha-glucan phosphorylase [Pseudobutyrivibrio sp. MD2005]|uniref:glycogen/starch/alpha-glucan phosphorylase n=1 Tax=Pseudobutyrivibrio sp. MD2005 TaxID=1410616 RepID=UPI0004892094|nr:glycogen/starch/alpha-glucan phosphorylase [Pseudobutyrivibrio sp. MD2005]